MAQGQLEVVVAEQPEVDEAEAMVTPATNQVMRARSLPALDFSPP